MEPLLLELREVVRVVPREFAEGGVRREFVDERGRTGERRPRDVPLEDGVLVGLVDRQHVRDVHPSVGERVPEFGVTRDRLAIHGLDGDLAVGERLDVLDERERTVGVDALCRLSGGLVGDGDRVDVGERGPDLLLRGAVRVSLAGTALSGTATSAGRTGAGAEREGECGSGGNGGGRAWVCAAEGAGAVPAAGAACSVDRARHGSVEERGWTHHGGYPFVPRCGLPGGREAEPSSSSRRVNQYFPEMWV